MTGIRRAVIALLAVAPLAGCGGGFFGEDEVAAPLPGERLAVMLLDSRLEADPAIAGLPVTLPPARRNPDWPQTGGNAAHALHHVELGERLAKAWSVDIGAGSDSETTLLGVPVVADGRVFAIDAEGVVSAFRTADGGRLWQTGTRPEHEQAAVVNGGLAVDAGRVFVATGYGEVVALSAEDGSLIWRRAMPAPMRGAPAVSGGQVFVITLDNRLNALSAEDGQRLWNHVGIAEVSALLGGPSPAVAGGAVAAPYSSGELYLLKVENGRVLWVDSLGRIKAFDSVSNFADIRGNPVADSGLLIAASHSGLLIAADMATGARIWERSIASTEMPWVAGGFIYVVTVRGEVVCLTRRDGRVRWVRALPAYDDPEDREGPIRYAGPVLAGNRLLLTDSNGILHALAPDSGAHLEQIPVGGTLFLPPVVADGTAYLLSDGATLTALR